MKAKEILLETDNFYRYFPNSMQKFRTLSTRKVTQHFNPQNHSMQQHYQRQFFNPSTTTTNNSQNFKIINLID